MCQIAAIGTLNLNQWIYFYFPLKTVGNLRTKNCPG